MSKYEAVIGYTEDEEIATWGGGETPEDALRDTVQRFIVDQNEYIEPGDYEATVYDGPLTRYPDDGGDAEVFAWMDRGTTTVNVSALVSGFAWHASPIAWDGVAVTP